MYRNQVLSVLFLLSAFAGKAHAQVFHAPLKVANGEAILFSVAELESGDQIRWALFSPRGIGAKSIQTKYGVEYIVDPPVGFKGLVEVQCTVVNFAANRFEQQILECEVAGGTKPDPKPPDPDDNDDVSDYPGPNAMGIGQVSFDTAPGYSKDVVQILEHASEYLFGRPETKVISTTDPEMNRTDYNVHVWIKGQLEERAGKDWVEWHTAVNERFQSNWTTRQWYDAFREAASGVKAKEGGK